MMKNSSGKSDSAAAADRPTFNQIVQDSLTKDDSHRAIVRRLQYAQSAIVRYGYRGNKLAHERFSELRDQLVHHVEALPAEKKADSEQILSYVEYQLGRL